MDRVKVDIKDHVALVRLARAEKKNALDDAMFDALIDAGESLARNGDARAVVLCGEGDCFCAGLDMAHFAAMQARQTGVLGAEPLTARTHGIANRYQKAAWVWREMPAPVIAAITGVAFGGGFQIALGADMRLATADARFSVMEIKWGIAPDMGGTQLMRHLARDDVIRELTYTGRIFAGEEALRLGFVTRVCADPIGEALALAGQIAQQNPNAIEASKRVLNAAPGLTEAQGLALESHEQDGLLFTPNQVEAVTAALQKRAPTFSNAR